MVWQMAFVPNPHISLSIKRKDLFWVEFIVCLSMDPYRRVGLSDRTGRNLRSIYYARLPRLRCLFMATMPIHGYYASSTVPGVFESYISLLFLLICFGPSEISSLLTYLSH